MWRSWGHLRIAIISGAPFRLTYIGVRASRSDAWRRTSYSKGTIPNRSSRRSPGALPRTGQPAPLPGGKRPSVPLPAYPDLPAWPAHAGDAKAIVGTRTDVVHLGSPGAARRRGERVARAEHCRRSPRLPDDLQSYARSLPPLDGRAGGVRLGRMGCLRSAQTRRPSTLGARPADRRRAGRALALSGVWLWRPTGGHRRAQPALAGPVG